MDSRQFVDKVIEIAQKIGYKIEINRQGLTQIDFGHKKLHEGHLRKMFPKVVAGSDSISKIIDDVAPGRPCSHRPMKEILKQMAMLN